MKYAPVLIATIAAFTASAHEHGHPDLNHTGGAAMPALPAKAKIEVRDTYRYITATGLPDHIHGTFPNSGNPNPIVPQNKTFRVPLKPEKAAERGNLGLIAFGVAVNGIPFEPSAAEFWKSDRNSGWQYEALSGKLDLGLDVNHAHVQPTGKYHYHGVPTGLMKETGADRNIALIGYAADGYPMYGPIGYSDPLNAKSTLKRLQPSYQLKTGNRPSEPKGPGGTYDGTFVQDYTYVLGSGELDEFNGRFGVTPEYPTGTYHYVVTESYPFISRTFRGTPDDSFRFGRSAPGADRGPERRGMFGRRPSPGGPGGLEGPKQGADPSMLLMHPNLKTWLDLTHDQERSLRQTGEAIRQANRAGHEGPKDREPEEIRSKMRASKAKTTREMNAALAETLSAKQQNRWQQLLRQQQGNAYLLTDEAKKALNLSPKQYSDIYTTIVLDRANTNKSSTTKPKLSLRNFLTAAQLTALDALLGETVNLEPPRMLMRMRRGTSRTRLE